MGQNNNPQAPEIQRPAGGGQNRAGQEAGNQGQKDNPGKKQGGQNPPRKSGTPDYGDRPDQLPTVEDDARETENPTRKTTTVGE